MKKPRRTKFERRTLIKEADEGDKELLRTVDKYGRNLDDIRTIQGMLRTEGCKHFLVDLLQYRERCGVMNMPFPTEAFNERYKRFIDRNSIAPYAEAYDMHRLELIRLKSGLDIPNIL